jgi:hypothetical protein
MFARFMAISHHTYLVMKMSMPNNILSIYNDIMVSFNCEDKTIDLASTSSSTAAAMVMVTQATKIDISSLEVPEQKSTPTTLDASPKVKKVRLSLLDAAKSPLGSTWTQNRNSCSPISSETMLIYLESF